jgi:hypothetical protein
MSWNGRQDDKYWPRAAIGGSIHTQYVSGTSALQTDLEMRVRRRESVEGLQMQCAPPPQRDNHDKTPARVSEDDL